ncbi:hypothetical protein BGZ97_006012 [Linnemannia gamsii]|uniref:Uncharacterized protein n=1 Tax=Linnemannia gamsii TaxID=64522 RepID=A0A9P6UR05_9FUNG|nr:hypothetical protein BGZ97_006012 [Linnemannia gamsii]
MIHVTGMNGTNGNVQDERVKRKWHQLEALSAYTEERKLAATVSPSLIDERWPNLKGIMERISGGSSSCSYEDVVTSLKKEDNGDELVEYIRGHAMKSLGLSMSEKGLRSLRGLSFKEHLTGTKERKNHGRDLLLETEEQASMADGVALFGDHQIYLAEASLVYEPKLDKQMKDKVSLDVCGYLECHVFQLGLE